MLSDDEKDIFIKFKAQYEELYNKILKTKLVYNDRPIFLKDLLKRPEINITKINSVNVLNLLIPYDDVVVFSVETAIKYEGYEQRELDRIAKIKKLDNLKIPTKTNYQKITNLSTESIEKLLSVKPETLGQASRIAGVRPSDIAVLSIFLTSHK